MPIEITVPGSKSISNRVLILAALSSTEIEIKNLASSTDTDYMLKALKQIGCNIEQKNSTTITIKPGKTSQQDDLKIYTHNAGTTTRFITALSTLLERNITIDGDKRMRERPIEPLIKALNELGAQTKTTNQCPPVDIKTQKLKGGNTSLAGNISSQYISALLLTTPFAEQDTQINITGKICSKPYIQITLDILESFKLKSSNNIFEQHSDTEQTEAYIRIPGNQKATPPKSYTVEADASSASYPAAYAALHHNKPILLNNIHQNSIQGDIKFLEYLEKMGCKITATETGTIIQGPEQLKSLGEIDMNVTPDLVMTFAVLAAFTPGTTKITNISNLRIKETDRLQALENELTKLGVEVKTGPDFIHITGAETPLNATKIKTYEDHRMAMSFAIIQDMVKGLSIENPECVEKSYKSFWTDLKTLENE